MRYVTSEANHENVYCSDEEIILSGPPTALRGAINLHNDLDEAVMIRELPLRSRERDARFQPQLALNIMLAPGENRQRRLSIALPADTPPGRYTHELDVGGGTRTVTFLVQETLSVRFNPRKLTLIGLKAGTVHEREILLTNHGNIPVTVPDVRHNLSLDMDLICRNLSRALKADQDSGIQETLDVFVQGIKADLADWIEVDIAEAGQTLRPGQTLPLHLKLTLPKDVDPRRVYEGDIRLFDQLISYIILPES